MEDFEIGDPNAGLLVGSDAGGGGDDDAFGSGSGSGAPDSSLSPLEIEGISDIEKMLGIGMSESDLAVLESLQFGMELTDEEADNNAGDSSKGKKKRKREAYPRKRLSLYQVYYLEKNFKIENRLEPERKYELAKELGMKPRQVTIWFQNRRARSKKNKDLDLNLNIDFDQVLKQYDSLQAEHEKLLEENKKLKAEMKDMRHEMVIMKDSLLKYGKLVRAGLLAPQTAKGKPGQQVKRTKQLQVVRAQTRADQVMNADNNNPVVEVNNNVCNEGVQVAPQVQVQVQQLVNSPPSENSVFDSNSPLAAAPGAQLLTPPVDYIPHQPVAEPEPGENNANLIQADQQENSVNNETDTIDNLINNMLDLDEQNGFSNNDFPNNEADAPQTTACNFGVNPMNMDDEASFWEFEV